MATLSAKPFENHMNEDGMKRSKLEPVASESQSLAGNTDASDGVDMTVNADAYVSIFSTMVNNP